MSAKARLERDKDNCENCTFHESRKRVNGIAKGMKADFCNHEEHEEPISILTVRCCPKTSVILN